MNETTSFEHYWSIRTQRVTTLPRLKLWILTAREQHRAVETRAGHRASPSCPSCVRYAYRSDALTLNYINYICAPDNVIVILVGWFFPSLQSDTEDTFQDLRRGSGQRIERHKFAVIHLNPITREAHNAGRGPSLLKQYSKTSLSSQWSDAVQFIHGQPDEKAENVDWRMTFKDWNIWTSFDHTET